MTKHFVQVSADVDCEWQGSNPAYRVYVNNELFAERTWIWTDSYLEELLQIEAEPGDYAIRFELVAPATAQLTVDNIRVSLGSGEINNNVLRIY
jgi:hypothetical protein